MVPNSSTICNSKSYLFSMLPEFLIVIGNLPFESGSSCKSSPLESSVTLRNSDISKSKLHVTSARSKLDVAVSENLGPDKYNGLESITLGISIHNLANINSPISIDSIAFPFST